MASDKLEGVGFELIPIDSKRIVMRFNSLRRGHIRLRKSNRDRFVILRESFPCERKECPEPVMVVCHTEGEEKRLDKQKRLCVCVCVCVSVCVRVCVCVWRTVSLSDSAVSIAWSKVALKL